MRSQISIVSPFCRNLLLCGFVALLCLPSLAQDRPLRGPDWDGHIVWVLPFQNNSASTAGVDWIGMSFPDIMNQRLSSAGFLTIRREDRRYALKHLGLPQDFRPTQATAYRLAQTLDADYVVFGNFTVADGRITASARVLTMKGPRMGSTLVEQGGLNQLIEIEDKLAWKIAMRIDPSIDLDEKTFLAASRGLRLDAFENYIRGETDTGNEERIAHLKKAVSISPDYVQAWFALGMAYFSNQQYEEAAVPFSKVPKGNRLWLETMFYAGLSHLYTGNYAKAQTEFAAIASVLPMPEVLNNEGIAVNRRGQNGTVFFQRIVHLDPKNPDYWFNLSVSQRRNKDYAQALKSVEKSLALRSRDAEAEDLRQNLLMLTGTPATDNAESATDPDEDVADDPAADDPSETQPSSSAASAETSASGENASSSQDYEPLERIARAYDESSFRQAAFEMEQMNAIKLSSLPPAEQAKALCRQGFAYVDNGLLLEAERQFQLALAADPNSAAGHAGLAEVHEYAGSIKVAQDEANKSLEESPNVAAYLVLARIALTDRSYSVAQENVEKAIAIEPNNSAANGILQAVRAHNQSSSEKTQTPPNSKDKK